MGWFSGDSADSKNPQSSPYESDSYGSNSGHESSFRSDDLTSSSSFGGPSPGGAGGEDAELQTFLKMEQQKAQMQTMIHKMNDICWDTCLGAPDKRLGSRTEACLSNCVERFIDSTLFIANRFATQLSKQAGGM